MICMDQMGPESAKSFAGQVVVKAHPCAEAQRAAVYQILEEAFICHVGFVVDGRPFVIPTGYARVGDKLYIHGSAASRMLRALKESIEVCVTITIVDGLVLARSAFHHSMNYRSVVIFGNASLINNPIEKLEALRAFSEHIVTGRWAEVRPPSANEIKATLVLSILLTEASAKIRTGQPVDDETDYKLPVWAGVIPLNLVAAAPVSDPRLPDGIGPPSYTENYTRSVTFNGTDLLLHKAGKLKR